MMSSTLGRFLGGDAKDFLEEAFAIGAGSFACVVDAASNAFRPQAAAAQEARKLRRSIPAISIIPFLDVQVCPVFSRMHTHNEWSPR